jgi:hypothetical protein
MATLKPPRDAEPGRKNTSPDADRRGCTPPIAEKCRRRDAKTERLRIGRIQAQEQEGSIIARNSLASDIIVKVQLL